MVEFAGCRNQYRGYYTNERNSINNQDLAADAGARQNPEAKLKGKTQRQNPKAKPLPFLTRRNLVATDRE